MSRRIKVLVLIPNLEIGGAEMDLVRVLPRLDRDRFLIVVHVLQARGALATHLVDAGIEVVGPGPVELGSSGLQERTVQPIDRTDSLRTGTLPNFLQPLRTGLKYFIASRPIARYLAQGRFDILHTMSPSAYVTGVLANGIGKRRMLVMSRVSLNFYQRESRLLGSVERLFHRRVDLAIGNSQAILSELYGEGIPHHKLQLARNGIDVPDFVDAMLPRERARDRLAVSQSSLVLTSVANLYRYKGHADLLNALHQLRDRLPADWVLLIAGRDVDGNLGRLRALADGCGLAEHIRFLGERRDIPVVLSASDIHVSASHYEGFPNNILEAMCAGLPVVATAVGGVPEQVADGASGFLVPPCNPDALAAALFDLSCDSALRATMGRAARERVALEFTIDRCVAAFEAIYTQLAERRGSRSETQQSPESAVQ